MQTSLGLDFLKKRAAIGMEIAYMIDEVLDQAALAETQYQLYSR